MSSHFFATRAKQLRISSNVGASAASAIVRVSSWETTRRCEVICTLGGDSRCTAARTADSLIVLAPRQATDRRLSFKTGRISEIRGFCDAFDSSNFEVKLEETYRRERDIELRYLIADIHFDT